MKKEIIERLKAQHYDEDLPWTFSAYKMADMLYGLNRDYYLETIGCTAWEWEQTLYLDYFEPTVNAIIFMDEQDREYNFETLDDIAEQIIKRDDLYKCYKAKFYLIKKLTEENKEKLDN